MKTDKLKKKEHELIIRRAPILLFFWCGRRGRKRRTISGDFEYTLRMFLFIKNNLSSASYYQAFRVTEGVFNPHDALSHGEVSLAFFFSLLHHDLSCFSFGLLATFLFLLSFLFFKL